MVNKKELYPQWLHLHSSVEEIHRMDEKFIAFSNEKSKHFDWEYEEAQENENFDRTQQNKLISQMTYVNTLSYNISDKKITNQFRELLADTFSNICHCDYENACYSLNEARKYILKFHKSTTRIWSLSTTFIALLISIYFANSILCKYNMNTHPILYMFGCSLLSPLGVFIFSFLNLNRKNLLIEYGRIKIVTESIFQIVINIAISFIILLIVKEDIIFSFVNNYDSEYSYLILSIVTGCIGESVFPKIISDFTLEYSSNIH